MHPTPVTHLHGGRIILEMGRRQQRWMVQDDDRGLSMMDLRDKVSDARFKHYLATRSAKHNGQWTYEGMQMLIRPGLTERQIGARYKLCLSRFDRDRQAQEHLADATKEAPKQCSCGCLNHLESWINVCTEPKTVDRIKLARVRIATMLENELPLKAVIAPLLAGPDQILLWRANWQLDHMEALATCYHGRNMTDQRWRSAQRALRAITEELIASSLDLHGFRREIVPAWTPRQYRGRDSLQSRKEKDSLARAEMNKSHRVTTFFERTDPMRAPSVPAPHPIPALYRRPSTTQTSAVQTLICPLPAVPSTALPRAPALPPRPTPGNGSTQYGAIHRYFGPAATPPTVSTIIVLPMIEQLAIALPPRIFRPTPMETRTYLGHMAAATAGWNVTAEDNTGMLSHDRPP